MGLNSDLEIEPFLPGIAAPLPDGTPVDFCCVTIPETRIRLSSAVQSLERMTLANGTFKSVVGTNARTMRGGNWLDKLATTLNANLKTIHACGPRFQSGTGLIGMFNDLEKRIVGIEAPNPKKSFIGFTFRPCPEIGCGVRFCFVGAHFPMQMLKTVIQCNELLYCDQTRLHAAKLCLATPLIRVLRSALRNDVEDEDTIIFLQGDLNSRTLNTADGPRDVLRELLSDAELQQHICEEAAADDNEVPDGEWRELVLYASTAELPVTYKFRTKTPAADTSGGFQIRVGDAIGATASTLLHWGIDIGKIGREPKRKVEPVCNVLYHAGGSDHRPVVVEAVLEIAPVDRRTVAVSERRSHANGQKRVSVQEGLKDVLGEIGLDASLADDVEDMLGEIEVITNEVRIIEESGIFG
eukprot:CAMPEP_0117608172 /NCGR_PEP_ID=MMETSP0784-20121206/80673_1 /TAXON_ID=39447 /ORGANISM="" /LENGTH=410 /DNA_ID=CAMNT_0005411441 /DNA_START=67 /DNA_END=1296 /DNA_ORIENTATION=+